MSKQNKKSIKQAFATEYNLILLLVVVTTILPVMINVVLISNLYRLSNLGILDIVMNIIGYGTFQFIDVTGLIYISAIVSIVITPIIAVIIGQKIAGADLLQSIKSGCAKVKTKNFWNYILKVYVPFYVVIIIGIVILNVFSDSIIRITGKALLDPNWIIVAIIGICLILSIIISSVASIIFVANSVYITGSPRIKAAFKKILTREINKLVAFNAMVSIVCIGLVLVFTIPLLYEPIIDGVAVLFSTLMHLEIILTVLIIVFAIQRYALYINVISKSATIPKEVKSKDETLELTESTKQDSNENPFK